MQFGSLIILLALSTTASAPGPPMPAAPCMDDFQVGPFHIRAEFPIKRAPLARDLAQIKRELETVLQLKIGKEPIQVYFFADRDRYRAWMKKNLPQGAHRPALFVKGQKGSFVYAYRSPTFDKDVRHECTHALVHNAVSFIPLWMDEGLAEYFEEKAGLRARSTRVSKVAQSIRFAALNHHDRSLPRLEAIDSIQKMGSSEYQDSWAWIHFLINDPTNNFEARATLISYLAEIQKGTPPGSFSLYLAKRLNGQNARLERHFKNQRFR